MTHSDGEPKGTHPLWVNLFNNVQEKVSKINIYFFLIQFGFIVGAICIDLVLLMSFGKVFSLPSILNIASTFPLPSPVQKIRKLPLGT